MRTPKSVADRRRSIRIDERLSFKIGHQDYEAEAVTLNISSRGALCVVDRDIPIMTQLKVALSMPKSGAVRAKLLSMKGVVVRKEKDPSAKKFYIAIYFSDIKPADREHLESFIQSRLAA